jgi:hypothetical protein
MDQANQGGTHVGGKLWRAARTTSLIVALGLTGSLRFRRANVHRVSLI